MVAHPSPARGVLVFLGRASLWATALAPPCWWLSGKYERLLAIASTASLHLIGFRLRLVVRMATPFDIGIFLALCCATPGVSWKRRAWTIGMGALILFGLDTGLALARFGLVLASGPESPVGSWFWTTLNGLLDTVPLLVRPALWFVLLGRRAFHVHMRPPVSARSTVGAPRAPQHLMRSRSRVTSA
jgi:uncharacterized membrane protein YedE/YeeE